MSDATLPEPIPTLLAAKTFAVVGASRTPDKYGFRVYRALKAAGKTVYAVNPRADEVDGDRCYPSLDALPVRPEAAAMIVPPAVTEAAVADCRAAKIAVVSGGPCLLVLLPLHSRS